MEAKLNMKASFAYSFLHIKIWLHVHALSALAQNELFVWNSGVLSSLCFSCSFTAKAVLGRVSLPSVLPRQADWKQLRRSWLSPKSLSLPFLEFAHKTSLQMPEDAVEWMTYMIHTESQWLVHVFGDNILGACTFWPAAPCWFSYF